MMNETEMVMAVLRLQNRVIDALKSGGDDVAGDVMDAVLRSAVTDPEIRAWYLAQVALDQCGRN